MGRRLWRVCIAGFLILSGTAWVACDGEGPPGPELDQAPSEGGLCTQEQVIESARRVTREYCSGVTRQRNSDFWSL